MYAGKVVDGIVVDSIVGSAEWAIENIGGEWHDSLEPIFLPGLWDEGYGFRHPQPSPDCWWENNEWVCPELTDVDAPL